MMPTAFKPGQLGLLGSHEWLVIMPTLTSLVVGLPSAPTKLTVVLTSVPEITVPSSYACEKGVLRSV